MISRACRRAPAVFRWGEAAGPGRSDTARSTGVGSSPPSRVSVDIEPSRFAIEPSRAASGVARTTKRTRADGTPSALWSAIPQHSAPCSSSAAESPHARHAPARRPQPRVSSSGDGWAAFADAVPISGGRIEDPTPLRGPHLVFCHVIAGAWNVRLTILFDQDGVAGEPPPLLSNTPFLRVCLGDAAIRRAGAPHADDVVASLAAHLFHVYKCPIRECAAHG